MSAARRDLPVPAGTFEGKVLLLCGSGGAVSGAIADSFRRAGARIASASAHADWTMPEPSADTGAIAALFDEIEQALGPVDVIVFAAPLATIHAAETLAQRDWRAIMRDSIDLAFLIGTEFARRCLAAERGGNILVITTNHATGGGAGASANAAAASALASLVQSWTVEWLGDDIRANHIEIGHIAASDDPAFELALACGAEIADSIPLARLGLAHEVASLALFLASPYAAYIAGASIRLDGGQWLRAGLGGDYFTPLRLWADARK